MQVKKKPKKTAKAVPEKSRKKKQPSEDQIKKQPFLKRMLFGEEKPDLSELEAGSTTILDILSPTTVDTKSRDYIIVDDVYHAYLYITGYGYTTTVGTCWLAPLVEAGEGINLSFLVKRQPKEKILSKIAQTTMVNRSRMRDVGDTRQDYEELDSAISSGLYLKDVMNRQGENFYYMHTLIEVTAPDSETLEQRVTEVEKLCVSVDMIARRCDYKNEQAFLSALPILALDPDIERKARRNALTSGVAAAFPFVSYELSDHDGIFLGLNLYNRSPVFLNPYDDYKYTSGNWWIGGSTGAGKTVTLQCLGGRLREQGKRVIIIVPKKGHEFRPLCERLGGLYLRMSPSSKDCPNLMAIRRKSLDSYAKLKNIAARDDSVLADKIAQLIIWFSLKKKDLNEEDKSRLDSSLVEVYKRYGITFDNSTIVDENGNFRTMPILSDWYEILYQEQDTRHLAVSQYHLRGRLKGGKTMLLSNQQKYILEILKEFKYLRVRQLHALVQAHYRTQGIKIDERRMEIMLRQMRTGTNYVWLRGDVVSYGDRRIDPRLLEALDVMLELTRVQPGFYSKDGLHEPFLLRFTGNGKGAGYLFSVAWLDAATHIATVPRMKGERIIWISESGSFGEIDLPRHHFFAARQKDGTHRFFGSNEPEKI